MATSPNNKVSQDGNGINWNIVTSLKTGLFLKKGIDLYNQKEFLLAKEMFYQALNINSDNHRDFTINFWLARVSIMLCDYEKINYFFEICNKLKPGLVKKIINPWDDFIYKIKEDITFTSEEIIKYNNTIDNNLEQCYDKKTFKRREILFLGLLLLIKVTFVASWITPYGISGTIIAGIIFALILLNYVHSKTELPLNFWIRCNSIIGKTRKLVISSSFLFCITYFSCFMSCFFIITLFYDPSNALIYRSATMSPLLWFLSLPVTSIWEELIFRLFLFTIIAKYNKVLGYLVTAFIFNFVHGTGGGPMIFIGSLILTWVYDKYKTIIAPIIIHTLSNTLTLCFYIIVKNFLLPK